MRNCNQGLAESSGRMPNQSNRMEAPNKPATTTSLYPMLFWASVASGAGFLAGMGYGHWTCHYVDRAPPRKVEQVREQSTSTAELDVTPRKSRTSHLVAPQRKLSMTPTSPTQKIAFRQRRFSVGIGSTPRSSVRSTPKKRNSFLRNVRVREASIFDKEQITELIGRNFGGSTKEAALVHNLRETRSIVHSWVAELKNTNEIIGFAFTTATKLDTSAFNDTRKHTGITVQGLGLHPFCVDDKFRNKGIGGLLVTALSKHIHETGGNDFPFLTVLGDHKYYKKFGFERAINYGIKPQWEVPDNSFQISFVDNSFMQTYLSQFSFTNDRYLVARYLPQFDATL